MSDLSKHPFLIRFNTCDTFRTSLNKVANCLMWNTRKIKKLVITAEGIGVEMQEGFDTNDINEKHLAKECIDAVTYIRTHFPDDRVILYFTDEGVDVEANGIRFKSDYAHVDFDATAIDIQETVTGKPLNLVAKYGKN